MDPDEAAVLGAGALVLGVHAFEKGLLGDPVRLIPVAVRIEDEHALGFGVICRDRSDMARVGVAGVSALDEVGDDEVRLDQREFSVC